MLLADVVPGARVAAGAARPPGDVEVTSLAYDARAVEPGRSSSASRASPATGTTSRPRRSRAAPSPSSSSARSALGVPEVLVDDVRRAMAPAAARLAGDPTAGLRTVGHHGDERQDDDGVPRPRAAGGGRAAHRPAGDRRHDRGRAPRRRRPHDARGDRPPADVRARCATRGDAAVVMEVSSHALALARADAIHWDVAVFTNLSQDHLDFHADMEDYFQAKRRLFTEGAPAVRVVNVDDEHGLRLAAEFPDAVTRRPRAPRRRPARDRPAPERVGHALPRRRASAHRAAARALQRPQRPLRGGLRARARRRRRRDRRRPGRGRAGARAASSPSTRASPSRCSSTTRTPRTRSSTSCGPRAA